MSDVKCPICGNNLERYNTGFVCYRHCLNGKNVWGSEETLKELIRTRKALDVAVDALKLLNSEGKRTRILGLISITDTALDKIKTALEQKGE